MVESSSETREQDKSYLALRKVQGELRVSKKAEQIAKEKLVATKKSLEKV